MEFINKEFFRDPKKVGIPMVTMHKSSGAVAFNLPAKERYDLVKYDYLMLARAPGTLTFYIIPTDDKKNGWKLTKYTNHVNTYLKICSQQLVSYVFRTCNLSDDTAHFYMHEDEETEKGFPRFRLSLKNY